MHDYELADPLTFAECSPQNRGGYRVSMMWLKKNTRGQVESTIHMQNTLRYNAVPPRLFFSLMEQTRTRVRIGAHRKRGFF